MGKKLDALLGRNFRSSKFKPQINLAVSRLAVLKHQRQARCTQARSDVVQLLQLGHHDRALLRVEHVVKEQNMLDVFVTLEGYCNLLIERIHLIENDRDCPEELREAISGLIFTSSRCGEFPELIEIRAVFSSRYGKEFVARAIELRNNCGVTTKLVQKLSTRQPDLENRMKALKEIAAENNILLHLEEASSVSNEENVDTSRRGNQQESAISTKTSGTFDNEEGFSNSMEPGKKYKDVAAAAQAAFESAAQAAAAARAAVELSRPDSHDSDNHSSPKTPRRRFANKHESNKTSEIKPTSSTTPTKDSAEIMRSAASSFNEVDPVKLLDKDVVLKESDDDESDDSNSPKNHSRIEDSSKQIPSNLRSGLKTEAGLGPVSEKTRQVRGY